MANLGNAWHLPATGEPRGQGGMRDPVGPVVPGTAITLTFGNQYQGEGNAANQLQDGSALLHRRQGDAGWTVAPVRFQQAAGNNKYFAATLPAGSFAVGDVVIYYFRIAYDDRDTTFVHAAGAASAVTAEEATAQAAAFRFPVESSAVRGAWSEVFALPNVAIHSHLLHTGQVLFWGRRDRPDQSLDVHSCTPLLWDPASGVTTAVARPTLADGTTINLFCSGHTFLADGRLLVTGGHLFDSQGLNQATVYDPIANTWTPQAVMDHGRWYPTATTLPDGRVLVTSGSYLDHGKTPNNPIPQIWDDGVWTSAAGLPAGQTFELYPRTHAVADDTIFMSGPLAQTWSLDVSTDHWTTVAPRDHSRRDYAPSVLYAPGRVLYVGGGNEPNTAQPTAATETIDLTAAPPRWRPVLAMHAPRRQHNATLLPDGTVLVTGGTRGGGGPGPGFNDLGPGQPVHGTELWNPATGHWTLLAAERVDRCYHSTAILLPDARVLSAGGGEYRPDLAVDQENLPVDSHRDAQIFSPPYLFAGPRPVITAAPQQLGYGERFTVSTPHPGQVQAISLVAPSSVTHSFNMSQRIIFLAFDVAADGLRVTAPAAPADCPPGYQMLFLISDQGVPSVAGFVRLDAAVPGPAGRLLRAVERADAPADAFARRERVLAEATGTRLVVGLTGTCPYGIAACWGGAHEGLLALEGVRQVDPLPDDDDMTATVFLGPGELPPLDRWEAQFQGVVNGSYRLRGIEATLGGRPRVDAGRLYLDAAGADATVELEPLGSGRKVQWDKRRQRPGERTTAERQAFNEVRALAESGKTDAVEVTGPLRQPAPGEYLLAVRVLRA